MKIAEDINLKKIFCFFMAVILSFSAAMPALQAVAINQEPAEITSADRRRTLLPELSESRQTTTEDETRPETRDTDTPAPMAEILKKHRLKTAGEPSISQTETPPQKPRRNTACIPTLPACPNMYPPATQTETTFPTI